MAARPAVNLDKKKNIFVSSAVLVSVIAIATKLLGFPKQVLIAYSFGASADTDAFYMAYGFICSITFAFFSALSVSFIPLYQAQLNRDNVKASSFLRNILEVFIIISILVTLVYIASSESITKFLLINSNEISNIVLLRYIRMFATLIVLECIITTLCAALQVHKIFFFTKSIGLFTNIIAIFVLLVLMPEKCDVLVECIFIGYMIQLLLMVFVCNKTGIITNWHIKKPILSEAKPLLFMIAPLLLGNGVYELNKTIDKIISSGFGEGGTSYLAYSQSFFDSICTVTLGSLVAVFFSYTTEKVSMKEWSRLTDDINNTVNGIYLIVFPIILVIITFGDEIISMIYGRGKFDSVAVVNTAGLLKGYVIGFPFLTIREVFSKLHYSFEDSLSPMKNSIIAVLINVIFSISLSKLIGLSGVSIATSVSYFTCAFLMVRSLKKHMTYTLKSNIKEIFKYVVAMIAGIVAGFCLKSIGDSTGYRLLAALLSVLIFYTLLIIQRNKAIVTVLNRLSRDHK